MKRSPGRWIAIPALLALASMLGCQGLSVGKSSTSVVTGSVTGILAAAPASVSFGNVPIGVTQSQNDVLTNTGSSTVMVTQEMVSGASFSTTGLSFPLTLAPQQTASFQIVFSPTASGSVNGTLALANDGSTGSVNIAVSGTGTAPGSLTTNPTSFNFGTVAIGSSQIQTETVKNTGGQNLTISAASISSSFALSGLTLPLTLAPNQSSSFGIVFAPGT
ncbi:MAG: choice-of-anchor D domain-containing protein, partial [Candidatus Sulfotelmatobacter sp.]